MRSKIKNKTFNKVRNSGKKALFRKIRYLEQEQQLKSSLPIENASCKNSDNITIKEERESTIFDKKQLITMNIGWF